MSQLGLFDVENKLAELSAMGDPLEKLDKAINWNHFKPLLNKAFRKERKSNAGRPPFDYVMMFKVLVLQTMYNLSDAQTQFQILDRFTFRRFLGIQNESQIPDEKTVWVFRETLTQTATMKKLFDMFDRNLSAAGYKARKGQIIDASFVEVPRQRNSRDENEQITRGKIPDTWLDSQAKLSQKDVDARWTKKNDQTFYGYKNHVNVDVKGKFIREYSVTPANVHDSQELENILDKENTGSGIWADSAYRSESVEKLLKKRGLRSHVHRKAYRSTPLTKFQNTRNTEKSRIRARVEHVFGWMENRTGSLIRSIGQLRAATRIGLMNLVYNMNRYRYLRSIA
jgi:Transposase and inactivated derivatives, IS5 family